MELNSTSSLISISNGNVQYGDILPGNVAYSDDSFSLSFNESIIRGAIIPVEVHFDSDNGYDRTEYMNITVGDVSRSDPMGPNPNGYYIYDSGDVDYELAPVYDWIEIDPTYGGDGIDLNLTDGGNGNNATNSTAVVDLPFTFYFYGEPYDCLLYTSQSPRD